MNKNAKKWVAALKSGKYSQAQWSLCKPEGYCCLGVACDVASKEGIIYPKIRTEIETYISLDSDDTIIKILYGFPSSLEENGRVDFYLLPPKVTDWLGLSTNIGKYMTACHCTDPRCSGYYETSLFRLNDLGKSFKEIAEVIESEPEGLFRE